MKIEQRLFSQKAGWLIRSGALGDARPQVALVFGGRDLLENPATFADLQGRFPGAHLVMASTSGEISGTEVTDDHIAVTAIAFEKSRVSCAAFDVGGPADSLRAGRELARQLTGPDLVNVFVLSDGAKVNGTDLARGFNEILPPGVILTGGLAGDGTRFVKTVVGLDGVPVAGRIVAIGFYGKNLEIGFASSGGWSPFGPERRVTRSEGNTLFELDGQSALELYTRYLGDEAQNLPGSAMRFPLRMVPPDGSAPVVRTILSIDKEVGSMVFAGDIPTGARMHFMRASYEDLISGAGRAAEKSKMSQPSDLAICVSCVGRRIVLGQRTEEETESIRDVLGAATAVTGFYSYGELAPAGRNLSCQLQNQTMTITALRET